MKDKTLLDLLESYLLGIDDSLFIYIKETRIDEEDKKKIDLCLQLGKAFWENINSNRIKTIIFNIGNEDFINDEDNLF